MPIHDWTRVDDGTFHDFQVCWTAEIRTALNRGVLPAGYYAQVGTAATLSPPRVGLTVKAKMNEYTALQRSLIIRHSRNHRIVALIEILSPGNKASEYAFHRVLTKVGGALAQGIHVVLIDLFPPSPRDPRGLHAAVWETLRAGTFEPPADAQLTLVSYEAGPTITAYVEPTAVGRALISLPLFLAREWYVSVPLETTYLAAWEGMPQVFRDILEPQGL